MVKPLVKPASIIKKRNKSFKRHQADKYKTMNPSWRKPHGIDNRTRRRFNGSHFMPAIGYGTDKRFRHVLPNGFKKFTVQNVKDLDILLIQNRKFAAEIGATVSAKNRVGILARARELDIRVINAHGRVRSEESA